MEIAVNLLSLVFQAVRGHLAHAPRQRGAEPVRHAGADRREFRGAGAVSGRRSVLLVTQVLRRAADYGLGKPPREMLFTVLNPGEQVQEQEPHRHGPAARRGCGGAVAVPADRRHRARRASRGSARDCAWCCSARRARWARAFETRQQRRSRRRGAARHERAVSDVRCPRSASTRPGKPHVDLRAIFRLAAPLMVTNAVQALLNLTDLWFIGRLSTDAVAAMGAIYWIMTCAILLFGGVGLAVQTFVAQAFGSRRGARASRALWNALWASLALAPLFLALAFAGPWLLHPFGLDPHVEALALEYWTPRMGGAFIGSMGWAAMGFFNGISAVRFTMAVVVVTTVSNAIAQPALHVRARHGHEGLGLGHERRAAHRRGAGDGAVPARRDRRGAIARR